jgi:hypothetical protein
MSTIVDLYIGGTVDDGGGQTYTADLILTSPYVEPAGNLLVLRSRPDIEPITIEWASTTPACTGSFAVRSEYNVSGTLTPTLASLTANFSVFSGNYATLTATLDDVTADFDGFIPQLGYLTATLEDATGQFNAAQVYDVSATFDATLETVYGGFTIGNTLKYCLIDLTLPEPILAGYTGAAGEMTLAELELAATGNDFDNARIRLTLPALELTALGGGTLSAQLPALELTASATQLGLITAALEIPAPILAANGRSSSVSQIYLTLPELTLTGQTGAYASLELLAPELAIAATTDGLARIDLTLPFLELTASASVGAVTTITLELPDLILTSTGIVGEIGTITLTLPALILTAYDVAINPETTYAVNLSTGAVTQLTLGRFVKLVTAHGRLYGLQADGQLVKLDEDTDHGTPIPATVRFAPQQFGTLQAKRVSDVYLNSREDDGLNLTLFPDETAQWRYQTPTDRAPALGTHKVKVGRGVTFHSLGLFVQNRNGGRLDVGGMELLVQPLSRKPR